MTKSVAVIGSGMAGLAAARLMHNAGYPVTIYEALSGRGMDSHTLAVDGGIVDAPLRVMNPTLWQNTLALATHLGISTYPVRTYMSCNWLTQDHLHNHRLKTWFKSQRTLLGNLPTTASFRFINQQNVRLVKGFFQLKYALQQFKQHPHQDMSLADFANQYQFDALFWYGAVLPVINTICTCDINHIARWPAKPLLTFLEKLLQGEPLLRLQGGTPALVTALSQNIPIISGSKVTIVQPQAQQVLVKNARGEQGYYDYVIVATPTTHLDFLPPDVFADELKLLKQFRFDQGELVIHRDNRFMPQLRQDWTVLNYAMNQQFTQQMFTIWINQLEPSLVDQAPVFQTWNPVFPIQPDTVLSSVKLTRAIVDQHTAKLVQQLNTLHAQSERQVFFCGSWSCDGLPILESAVTSALAVAERLGVNANFKGKSPIICPAQGLPS